MHFIASQEPFQSDWIQASVCFWLLSHHIQGHCRPRFPELVWEYLSYKYRFQSNDNCNPPIDSAQTQGEFQEQVGLPGML